MKRSLALLTTLGLALTAGVASAAATGRHEISRYTLEDKIRGGLVGQLLGNLNGLPHEFAYIDQPGNVTHYVPALPAGVRTDDDTDIEWVYLVAMQEEGRLFLPPQRIVDLWKKHINQRIWSANQYARQLMDLGLEPPLTGHAALNPWSRFNIAGQFNAEMFALMAPGLPQTASRVALHYTTVVIDGEPAQSTQLFATMIATAFVSSDLDEILDAGVAALDPKSELREIVADVRRWHRSNPEDWRATRASIKEKYSTGGRRSENGYELNTACVVAALLYGRGDFVGTLTAAFNCGWDADCNAATAGTVVGVIKGWDWMRAQGWEIADRYRNTTREGMPEDETLTRLGSRILELAEKVVVEVGGERVAEGAAIAYRLPEQRPAPVRELVTEERANASLQRRLRPQIRQAVTGSSTDVVELARAAYLAICLDLAPELSRRAPERWRQALDALTEELPQIGQALFFRTSGPSGEALRQRALAAGLPQPASKEPLWTVNLDLYGADLPPLPAAGLADRLYELGAEVRAAFAAADIDALIDLALRLEQLHDGMARSPGELAEHLPRLRAAAERLQQALVLGERSLVAAAVAELTEVIGKANETAAAAQPTAATRRRPNIVLIYVDDMGTELGAYGDAVARTPNLDRLAREGVLFSRAYTATPSCSASRAALLTGRYPHTNGVRSLIQWHWPSRREEVKQFPERLERTLRHSLKRPEIILPQQLKELGYATGIFMKWHVSIDPVTEWGFDQYWAEPEAFIAQHRDRPFFYYFAPVHTHVPFWSSPDFPYDPSEIPLPPYFRESRELREDLAQYYSAISNQDREVGRILATLDREGLTENTIVVFSSDNGPPYARAKATLYEWGIREPLLVRYPARLEAGQRLDALASTIDVYPTILDLLGERIPERLQGMSLAPLMTDPETTKGRDAVFAELTHHGTVHNPMRSVRTERWKYIRNFDPTAPFYTARESLGLRLLKTPLDVPLRPVEELYDLAADPYESRNLAADPDHREPLLELRATLQSWIVETQDDPLSELDLVSPGEARHQPGGWYGRPEDPAPNRRDPREAMTYESAKKQFPHGAGVPGDPSREDPQSKEDRR